LCNELNESEIMILKKQKGVAIVEFALVVPILLYLVFGTLQFGWLLMKYLTVVNAAAVGSLFLASQGTTTATPFAATTAAVCGALGGALGTTASLSTALSCPADADVTVTMTLYGTLCSSNSLCSAQFPPVNVNNCNKEGNAAVTVTYTFHSLLPGVEYIMPTTISRIASTPIPKTYC